MSYDPSSTTQAEIRKVLETFYTKVVSDWLSFSNPEVEIGAVNARTEEPSREEPAFRATANVLLLLAMIDFSLLKYLSIVRTIFDRKATHRLGCK